MSDDNVFPINGHAEAPCDVEPPCETGYQSPRQVMENLPEPKHDVVNRPSHYNRNGIETWDIIEHIIADYPDPICAYHVASMVKYCDRAAHKDEFYENMKKAMRHAQRLSKHLRSK